MSSSASITYLVPKNSMHNKTIMNAVTSSKTALGSVMTPYIIEDGTRINMNAIQISTFDLKTTKKHPFYLIAYNKEAELKIEFQQ